MPSFVEKINSGKDLAAFQDKAKRYGLPQALLFTSLKAAAAASSTAPQIKYLSTAFRLRMLVGEVTSTKANKDAIETYGIVDFPTLLMIPPTTTTAAATTATTPAGEEEEEDGAGKPPTPIKFEGKSFSKNRLDLFFSKHALKKAIPLESAKKKTKKGASAAAKEETKQDHPEL